MDLLSLAQPCQNGSRQGPQPTRTLSGPAERGLGWSPTAWAGIRTAPWPAADSRALAELPGGSDRACSRCAGPAPAQPAPEPGADPGQWTTRTVMGSTVVVLLVRRTARPVSAGDSRYPAQRRPLPDHLGPLAAATDRRAAAEPGAAAAHLRARPDLGGRRQRRSGTGCIEFNVYPGDTLLCAATACTRA